MTEQNKNLVVRIVSALVLLPVVLYLLWVGPKGTAGLLAFACGALAFEFFTITMKKLDLAQLVGIALAAACPVLLGIWPEHFGMGVVSGMVFLIVFAFTHYLIRGPLPEAPVRVGLLVSGTLYSGLLLGTVAGLRHLPQGFYWIILALAVTWLNDTGAYAAGRMFGKHKLYPAVSPGKTWEGFYGGIVASLVAAFGCKYVILPSLSVVDCIAIALPCAVLGPLGDLSESMIKRAYGVKDSGKIIPGHGGLLDRVDALMFNAPYIWLYLVATRFS